MHTKKLIVIAGPTAVGKTACALALAEQLNTEILSADSRQIYKELNIGTAKPTHEELERVRHHFINHISIHQYYSAGIFEAEALNLMKRLFSKYDHLILCGGSGLYIKAVCHGIDELPQPDEQIRNTLQKSYETKGLPCLLEQLNTLDPDYVRTGDIHNHRRVMRALEVCLLSRKPYTSFLKKRAKKRPFGIVKILLQRERDALFQQINKRVEEMMQNGLLNEASALYRYRRLNALKTVGYRELFEHLAQKTSLKEAVERIKRNSRRYARMQISWFKKESFQQKFHPEDVQGIMQYLLHKTTIDKH